MSTNGTTTWHVPSAALAAYAVGDLAESDAWSIEAHVSRCERCADGLAAVLVGTPAGESVAVVWSRLAGDLQPQARVPRSTAIRRAVVLATSGSEARWAWWLAVAVTLLGAVVLHLVAGGRPPEADDLVTPARLLLVLSPVLPLIGVAASYAGLDPVREAVAATPVAGLTLLLWRTVAVLVVSLPAALVAGAVVGVTGPTTWLLPALALTVLTLAAGSVIDTRWAALAVGAIWVIATIPGWGTDTTPVALEARSAPAWLALLVLGCGVVYGRRRSLTALPTTSPQESA